MNLQEAYKAVVLRHPREARKPLYLSPEDYVRVFDELQTWTLKEKGHYPLVLEDSEHQHFLLGGVEVRMGSNASN